jgi:colanic acid/amylovoran biosynthesis glycosyltransferase
MLLYVLNDHPSVSETFVVTEAASVRDAGLPLVGYALRDGKAGEPAAPLDLVRQPPSMLRLVLSALRASGRSVRELWAAKRYRISLREAARLVLAEAHAEYALPSLKGLGINHVHAHFLGRTADVAQAISRRLECEWTVTAHAADGYTLREPALFRRRLDEVSGIACANGRVEAAIVRHASRKDLRTRVIHCGVDVPWLARLREDVPERVGHIVTIARLVATKGHWTILAAATEVLERDTTLRWTIIGGGELYDELRSDARYQALHPRLNLAGPMDHATALRQLASASVFVLPCEPNAGGDSDGIPVALMEAMAIGIPVITTNTGGISELVVNELTGLIVRPRDAASLGKALDRVLYELGEQKLDRIRAFGRARVASEFSTDREAAKLIEFIGCLTEPSSQDSVAP